MSEIVAIPPVEIDILGICRKVKEMVDYNMVWTEDAVVFGVVEHWVSHADWILAHDRKKGQIRDDCDGFALTSAELCVHFGVPSDLVRVIYCEVPQFGGHLICAVDDPKTKDTWILDNNERRVISWKHSKNKFFSSLRLSERDTAGWRDIPV